MFHIEPTISNLRAVGTIGIVFIVFVLAAFLLTPVLFGLDATLFGDAFQNPSVDAVFEREQWAFFLAAITAGGGAFLMGAYFQILITRLFLPRQYDIIHSLIVLLDSTAVMITVVYLLFFFYSQIEALTGEERRHALVLAGLCSMFYALLVSITSLIIVTAIYRARTAPRQLCVAVMVLTSINLFICFYSLNPALPEYRIIMGLPLAGVTPVAFTAYCFILANALKTTETMSTVVTQ